MIADLLKSTSNESVRICGWIRSRRQHGEVTFLDVEDASGVVQCVVHRGNTTVANPSALRTEAAIEGAGRLVLGARQPDFVLDSIRVVGAATLTLSPTPRRPVDFGDSRYTDYLLSNRHFFLRNPYLVATLRARSKLTAFLHAWFQSRGYIEIAAPILTELPLYDDHTALSLSLHDHNVYLTQCVGFYLEAAVHAHERVYNLGPSFRGEEGRSLRHLIEYWHVKAELAWVDRPALMALVEDLIFDVIEFASEQCQSEHAALGSVPVDLVPRRAFPQISYRDALDKLNRLGHDLSFGQSLGQQEEQALSKSSPMPFWVVGIPRSIEPFPYCIDPSDPDVTLTADLILPDGYGELLGIAEKIADRDALIERMSEKGKLTDPRYAWLIELRDLGCVPHGGIGMGLERLLRWLFQQRHVRDFAAFPRAFGRRPYP